VLRRQRADGWTVERQQDFIAALADRGLVEHAARVVGMSATSCYRLRRAPGAENFAAAWDAALGHAAHRLVDLAFDRAINGSDEPVFDNEGNRVGRRRRYDHRMMTFLMRAYLPDRFRHAHQAVVNPGETPPPALPPIDEVLQLLAPVTPDQPALTMSPQELADEVEIADAGNGRLPHWYRGGEFDAGVDLRDVDPALSGAPPAQRKENPDGSCLSPALDEAFEKIVEEAKRAADGRRGRAPDDAQNSD
jgi:hypothetical protein